MEKRIINKVILMGAGASGKDYAKTILTNFGFKPDVSVTTRLPRIGEKNGEDYIFINETMMLSMVKQNKFLQWNQLSNGACYGTTFEEWESKNVFIMTPNVIRHVNEHYKNNNIPIDFLTIGFDIDQEIRFERMVKSRKFTVEEADLRISIDKPLFKDFHPDIKITNPTFNDVELLNSIFTNNNYDTADLMTTIKKKA